MGCPLFLAEMVFIFILLSRLGRLTTLEHDCFVYRSEERRVGKECRL